MCFIVYTRKWANGYNFQGKKIRFICWAFRSLILSPSKSSIKIASVQSNEKGNAHTKRQCLTGCSSVTNVAKEVILQNFSRNI